MENLEKDIQKKILSLCNTLPSHLETWKIILKEAQNPAKALANFAEQVRFVENADIKYMENFNDVQQELQIKILDNIEDELKLLRIHIEKLNKANQDLKNKLSMLERATIDLDWDLDSPLLKGSPIQPPLNKILQMSYEYWIYFFHALKNINTTLRALNVRDQKSVDMFEKSFCLNLDRPAQGTGSNVYLVLALTQYVVNEKGVN